MMTQESEQLILGEMYIPYDPVLVQERMQARILTRKLFDPPEEQLKERSEIVNDLFGTTGDNIHLES
ncbi:acetyltransferase, partial [Bacillus cereus]|nr:acetyltransferase [Bacillus cereus]